MKRLVISVLTTIVLLISIGCSPGNISPGASRYSTPAYPTVDYSYAHWREISHVPVPACTLPSVESGDTEIQGDIVCKETGLAPTRSQLIEWSSYTIWDSCYQYNQRDACEALSN